MGTNVRHRTPLNFLAMDSSQFHSQYALLRDYLASDLALGNTSKVTAKDKLMRLPFDQFYDVSTDLADEIRRRMNAPETPFLPVRNDLIPKRNQARQKMATLPIPVIFSNTK